MLISVVKMQLTRKAPEKEYWSSNRITPSIQAMKGAKTKSKERILGYHLDDSIFEDSYLYERAKELIKIWCYGKFRFDQSRCKYSWNDVAVVIEFK